MLDGVMLLWFVLAACAVLFVAVDIRTTPESPVMKWGFVLVTAYTGVVGAFLYVLGCREPLPGTHEQYVARWAMGGSAGPGWPHRSAAGQLRLPGTARQDALERLPKWLEEKR